MIYNRIPVAFGGSKKITGPTISYQYDVTQVLVITGLALPTFYEVDFCNEGDATTITMTGTESGVPIPDDFLQTGKRVKAYIVLTGQDEGAIETRYEITLPVNPRPRRTDMQPTPAQQLQIDTLIDALNDGVTRSETAAGAAEQAETEIGTYVERAETAAENAETSERNAAESANRAANMAGVATSRANAAASSAVSASQAAAAANTGAGSAAQSASSASGSASAAAGSASSAAGSASAASASAGQAASSASAASGSATKASGSAQAAANSASSASQSATNASNSASTASSKAQEAASKATEAGNAKDAAVTAKEAAETAQGKAEDAQAAAEEAAESIEESAAQIAQNTSEVEAFYSARTICPAPWTQGRLSESTGENTTSTTRCRSNSFTFGAVAKEIVCAVPEGYKFAFFEYNSSGQYTERYQWRTYSESGVVSITPGYKYRFLIAKTDNSNIAPNDVPANALTITYNVNQVNTDIATLQDVDKLQKFVAIPNSNAGNGYISGATGYRNNSDMYVYTDYIDVSGYSRIYYSRPGTSGSTIAAGMAFYDANKTFVSGRVGAKGQSQIGFIADIDYIDVPANAKYARFTKYISSSYGTFSLYGVPKIVGELEKAKNGITVKRNSKTDVLDMLSLAQSYLSQNLVYGYDTILQVSTETNQIDCSSFVGLCLRGYSYDETSYATSEWVSPSAWVASPDHDWSVNPYDYTVPITANLPNAPASTFGVVRTAAQIAQWMVERGQTVPMDEHLANIEPGDILFYARQNSNNEFIEPDRYEKINHCAICLTKEPAPDSESWDKTKYPYKHTLIDARTRTGAIGIETVEDGQNDPAAVSANNINTLVLICRPDLTN